MLPVLITPFPTRGKPKIVDDEVMTPLENEDDTNKLWVIVRYMSINGSTNEYRISPLGGETIKIGRVKFRVREIAIGDKSASSNITNSLKFNPI